MTNLDPLLLPNILVTLFVFIMLAMAVINTQTLRNLNDYKNPRGYPRISVLVPARNEEDNIYPCVKSLLAQDYPDFRVIVLDDNSTDLTGAILSDLARQDERLRVIKGLPLPHDWLGKHWACHQLYRASDGGLLMFTDADTVHTPDTLRCAAAALEAENADMLSIIPQHKLVSWAEKLAMPIFALGVFASVPLPRRLRPRDIKVLSSSGKLLLFRRRAYEKSGGFEAIKQNVLDDLQLPQEVTAAGMRYRLFDGTNNVSCRMYHNLKEVHEGLSKNTFAAFGYSMPLSIFTWLWITFVFWEPVIALGIRRIPEYPPLLSVGLAAISVLASILLFTVYYQRFKFPLHAVFLYPFSIVLMTIIAFSSMFLTLSGQTTWKDRKLPDRKLLKNETANTTNITKN
ncbi:MAG: glycosyltransferase [Chloroflexi bacterium]|nr:glycosyltransferase [Chloroflexota bacterium]